MPPAACRGDTPRVWIKIMRAMAVTISIANEITISFCPFWPSWRAASTCSISIPEAFIQASRKITPYHKLPMAKAIKPATIPKIMVIISPLLIRFVRTFLCSKHTTDGEGCQKQKLGTIYKFTPTTICSISTTSKKATSKRKSSFIVRYSLQRAKI